LSRSPQIRERIRALNDALRQRGPVAAELDQWLLTPGVVALGPDAVAEAIEAVRTFDAFTPDNDPYGEHDFGSWEFREQSLFWKIDCYDRSLSGGSPDPADPDVTRRVLTIMLALEY
jgi:hypothetical protein